MLWDRSSVDATTQVAVAQSTPAADTAAARGAAPRHPMSSTTPPPALPSDTDREPARLDSDRPVRAEDLEGPSDDEIRAEEERVAAIEAARARELADSRPPIDPRELGFADEASMHEAWRKKLGIPADRMITMQRGERDGRPVIDVLVPPAPVRD
jgi:hypothetical protein